MRHETCALCEQRKPVNQFEKSNESSLQRSEICIDCTREQAELATKKLAEKSQEATSQQLWRNKARRIFKTTGLDRQALFTEFRKIDHLRRS